MRYAVGTELENIEMPQNWDADILPPNVDQGGHGLVGHAVGLVLCGGSEEIFG